MKTDWKVDDWCFCDFKLQKISEIEIYKDGNAIVQVTDGYFSHFSKFLNDTCFPLTVETKRISEHFEGYSKRLHAVDDLEFKRGFPDIHREIIRRWCECCNDKENIEKYYGSLESWFYRVTDNLEGLRKMKLEKIEGNF